ncbi:GNAT family N-acetyltransferase [Leifsonia poae]|uniref:GNAT family N-acetyltransferase n=1 Tax=Leifsonia poae TaxID=110933 RepID=UPI001CBD3AC5|nr:GNAT family N-acetyltransferase [Leifsonia poae]
MLTGDIITPRLTLACLTEDDATEAYRGWLADPEVSRYLESRFAEPTIESTRAFITAMRESSHSYLFGLFVRETGLHCGNIKLGPVDTRYATGTIGLMIGDKGSWGQGFASEAIGAITRWAFGSLRLEKLNAGAYASNIGSVRAFHKNGFLTEGVQRSQVVLDSGAREDVVLLGATRSDFTSGDEQA